MSIVDQARAELVRAFNALPERGVTAERAFVAAESALKDYSAQMLLITWEHERVERVIAARTQREESERARTAARESAIARIERRTSPKGKSK